jgi:hypothetical protein
LVETAGLQFVHFFICGKHSTVMSSDFTGIANEVSTFFGLWHADGQELDQKGG